jgi:outer membrane murein-binding lipoprotein Lpp
MSRWHLVMALILGLLFLSACTPANQKEEELHKEVQALQAKIVAIQTQLDQLQGEQQVLIALMKQPPPAPAPAPQPEQLAMPNPMPVPQPLTVGQLLANKDRYLGTRVTVKGQVGPVMIHHKSLMVKSPQGMIEVLFGNLPDPKKVQTLTNTPLEDKTITVTGVVNLAPARGAGAQLQINAEAVQF